MSDAPRVTVFMPVYNGERYLRLAIDSILAQTYGEFEFLIIDDGSTDSSIKIINSFNDKRIRLLRNKSNLGLVATRNRGLQQVRSEYIALMDCDDISLPRRLADQVSFLDKNPAVGILGTACQIMEGANLIDTIWSPPERHYAICWIMYYSCPLSNPTIMMRKSIFGKLGGYGLQLESQYGTEDYELWSRVQYQTLLANLPTVYLYLRRHQNNITQIQNVGNWTNRIRISHQLIRNLLGEEVPIEIVDWVLRNDYRKIDLAKRAAQLILDLSQAFCKREHLVLEDGQFVRRDAAGRIFRIGYNLYKAGKPDWQILRWAWHLDSAWMSRTSWNWLAGKVSRS